MPRRKSLAVMALGLSVPTPKGGLMADVVVVDNLASLTAQKEDVCSIVHHYPLATYY